MFGINFLPFFRNSIITSLVSTFFVMLLAIPCAYALALYRPKKWKDILFFFISTRFLPVAGVIVPLYVIFSPNGDPQLGGRGLNLLGTLPGLILLYTAMNLPIAVWMLRSFFEEVPRDVLDAARVDGAGLPREMLQIVLPMVAPGSGGDGIHLDHLCLERVLSGIQPGAERVDGADVHGSLRDVGRIVLGEAGRLLHDGGVPDRPAGLDRAAAIGARSLDGRREIAATVRSRLF